MHARKNTGRCRSVYLLVVLIWTLCFTASGAAFGAEVQSPQAYLGLFTDSEHNSTCAKGTGIYSFEMWIWCLPSGNGQMCAEFAIRYPANIIQSTVTANTALISVSLGDLPTGMSVCYNTCQHSWNWCFHQTLWVLDQNVSTVDIIPHPEAGAYQFANCLPGYPTEPVNIFSEIEVNECWNDPPHLTGVTVESPTSLCADFNKTPVNFSGWHSQVDRFRLYERDDPGHGVQIISAEYRETARDCCGDACIALSEELEPGTVYVLEANGICTYCCSCGDSEIEFSFDDLPALADLAIVACELDRSIMRTCAPWEFTYTVRNSGYVPADSFHVMLHARSSDSAWDVTVGPIPHEGLDPDEETGGSITIDVPSLTGSWNELDFEVDCLDRVEELAEFNNLYRPDFLLNYTPLIVSIEDVPADTGGWIDLRFRRSHGDYPTLQNPVQSYEIFMLRETFGVSCNGGGRAFLGAPQSPWDTTGWDLVGKLDATFADYYDATVPTRCDSSGGTTDYWTTYLVRAVRAAPDTVLYYVSCPDSGYSVINQPTATLLAGFSWVAGTSGEIELEWRLLQIDAGVRFSVERRSEGDETYHRLDRAGLYANGLACRFRDGDVEAGLRYRYRLLFCEEGAATMLLFETDWIAAPVLPLTLFQNHPNPFNPSTVIPFYLPTAAQVTLDVYDVSGRLISRLVEGLLERGRHETAWDGLDGMGTQAASGIYFCRLSAGKETLTRKMVLLR